MERYVIATAGILFQCQHDADSMICFPDDTKGETGTKKNTNPSCLHIRCHIW